MEGRGGLRNPDDDVFPVRKLEAESAPMQDEISLVLDILENARGVDLFVYASPKDVEERFRSRVIEQLQYSSPILRSDAATAPTLRSAGVSYRHAQLHRTECGFRVIADCRRSPKKKAPSALGARPDLLCTLDPEYAFFASGVENRD